MGSSVSGSNIRRERAAAIREMTWIEWDSRLEGNMAGYLLVNLIIGILWKYGYLMKTCKMIDNVIFNLYIYKKYQVPNGTFWEQLPVSLTV